MTVIIDPLVTGFSHEMVNSGFVYSLSKRNPDKEILFIAEAKHIECIKSIFSKNDYEPTNIDYLLYNNYFDKIKIITKLIKYSRKSLIEKYIFLSFDAMTISLVYKFINQTPVYLVCHAIMESLIDNSNQRQGIKKTKKDILNKISKSSYWSITKLTIAYAKNYIYKYYATIINKFFNFKKIFLWQSKNNVTYIVLSDHIIKNLSENQIVHKNKIESVIMPYIFPVHKPISFNEKLNNFGIIGYGSPQFMKNIVEKINSLSLLNKYTFWNIGANSSGLEEIENLLFPVTKRYLTREEIDEFSKKLDFILILYDKTSYTLSCSASILEAILYVKPIIYLDNSCINEFNKHNIGIKCESIEELIECIVDIINYPEKYKEQYEMYMKNIVQLRNTLDLENREKLIGESNA